MVNVFVSHRKVDAEVARSLGGAIAAAGHVVWFDEWEIFPGDSIVAAVGSGLASADYLILCCSSAGTSAWVDREWQSSLARQLSGASIRVLPVLFPGGSVPAILADLKYADISSDFNSGIAELLRALR